MPQGTQPRKKLVIKAQWNMKSDHSCLESNMDQLSKNGDASCGHANVNRVTGGRGEEGYLLCLLRSSGSIGQARSEGRVGYRETWGRRELENSHLAFFR